MNAPDQREVWCVNDMLSTCKGAKHVGGSEATDLASMEEGHPPPCAHARPPPPAPGKGIVRGGQGDKGEEPDTMSTGAGEALRRSPRRAPRESETSCDLSQVVLSYYL